MLSQEIEPEWEHPDELLFLITESSRYKIAHVGRMVILSMAFLDVQQVEPL